MPELPEVTTITNQLNKEIVGSIIADVVQAGGYKTQPEFAEFKRRSEGSKVLSVKRIAKNIVIELGANRHLDPSGRTPQDDENTNAQDDGKRGIFLVIHLAMTGRLLLRKPDHKTDPWTRLVFRLTRRVNGLHPTGGESGESKELRFCDARMFGFVRLMNQDELNQYAGKYGPDALDDDLSAQKLLSQLRKKKTEVKRALLEQDLIAGAGNIYVNDSLWMAGIHPQTRTDELQSGQVTKLLEALQEILRESIKHRGSTLGDKMYIDVYGQEGEHQGYFRVFGKANEACPRCGTKIEFMEIGGRGTFFCPNCQVKPGQTKLL